MAVFPREPLIGCGARMKLHPELSAVSKARARPPLDAAMSRAVASTLLLACGVCGLHAASPWARLHPVVPRTPLGSRLRSRVTLSTVERTAAAEPTRAATAPEGDDGEQRIVLISGFESFNVELYRQCAAELAEAIPGVRVDVFSDRDLTARRAEVETALERADAFVGSLLFDYDDVEFLLPRVEAVRGPRLVFECATELMAANRVGSFEMAGSDGASAGPPPAVKAVLSKFGSGKEEDKLAGYLKLLKVGPELLSLVPGEKASDLRSWLTAYRYWNQGGKSNVRAMLTMLAQQHLLPAKRAQAPHGGGSADGGGVEAALAEVELPALVETPALGLLHPLARGRYFATPAEYVRWRESDACAAEAERARFSLAPPGAPRVAVLLFRKHVITEQPYIPALLAQLEAEGLCPVPIFINGVEAHTVVRDLLTSEREREAVRAGRARYEPSFDAAGAATVDAVVNTIGFPLVGGPAGSMEAGRNVPVAQQLLSQLDVPYIVAAPLLLQDLVSWKRDGVQGLQSVVLYALPELDGAIDTVVLGGLAGDRIGLVPERVRKLAARLKAWVRLRRTPKQERKLSVLLYGFPPNVGAVGTAALLNVPASLEQLLGGLHAEGYDLGGWADDPAASGEALVAALALLTRDDAIAAGPSRMEQLLEAAAERARAGDKTVSAALGTDGAGLGGARVRAVELRGAELRSALGPTRAAQLEKCWGDLRDRSPGPGVSADGGLVVAGLQIGNVWIGVQPLLGLEGDPMRLLFERDLTPHPQYVAFYHWLRSPPEQGGLGSQALVHFGMHGTVEWLPGQPLGNDARSWPDTLLGDTPNLYIYAANNPSESTLAKRRGYGTLVSHNVPPYGRAGLYLELAQLRELVDEYRAARAAGGEQDEAGAALRAPIASAAARAGLLTEVPWEAPDGADGAHEAVAPAALSADADPADAEDESERIAAAPGSQFDAWLGRLLAYLAELQNRLFSSGLHTLGATPGAEALECYLEAYCAGKLSHAAVRAIAALPADAPLGEAARAEGLTAIEAEALRQEAAAAAPPNALQWLMEQLQAWQRTLAPADSADAADAGAPPADADADAVSDARRALADAHAVRALLGRSAEELGSLLRGLDGGYVPAAPGGDLLRDGAGVLPTGRNIHSLDPYRMPSEGAWARGRLAAQRILEQHRAANRGAYPETVAVTMWGLDAIKTRGESVAIALELVGARPVKEGTGRVVRFELVPLAELGRPRVDVLASLSGIFRDSFANVVDLLDDLFERAAAADDEPAEQNFVKKHADELRAQGVERPAARLFSNPPGDYGSMVNERVGSGEWEQAAELGDTWASRNAYSYGRAERSADGTARAPGAARPEVLDKLLSTTERVVQEVDSVEYGLTDIQEYYANTGALKVAAEQRGGRERVAVSIVEAFAGGDDVRPRDLEQTLRLEYRSKLLNPKWAEAMAAQGAGGAYEVSQRMTAMVGWAATSRVDKFVFDGAAERYALDAEMAARLQRANPEAFKNVVRRLLEAAGRGLWDAEEDVVDRLKELYEEADDLVEGVGT